MDKYTLRGYPVGVRKIRVPKAVLIEGQGEPCGGTGQPGYGWEKSERMDGPRKGWAHATDATKKGI